MLYTAKEIRRVVREGMTKKGDRSLYNQARLAKKVLLFDPEYGEMSGTVYGKIDYVSFLTAMQAMANILNMNIWQVAAIVYEARYLAVDTENFQFHMPSTKAVIEALK